MKFRAITMGIIQENGRPLQTFSDSMEVVNAWAHDVSKKHKVDVKIYETYERVLCTIRKPYEPLEQEKEFKKSIGCTCGERVYCSVHPWIGWQKGRKA